MVVREDSVLYAVLAIRARVRDQKKTDSKKSFPYGKCGTELGIVTERKYAKKTVLSL